MQTTTVVQTNSSAISVSSPSVTAQASCGAPGKLLGGSFKINGSPQQKTAVMVTRAEPDTLVQSITVELNRLGATGDGATVTAYAYCVP